MENCVFCKIAKKEIPAHMVYEDNDFMAFLDINPQSPGHVQVIPKNHCRWVWEVPNIGEYFEVVKKIALAQQKAFGTNWILSKIVGDEIEHAHVWIYPAKAGEKMEGLKDFEINAEKIKKFI
jgi:histidine triad (HIT) family protein